MDLSAWHIWVIVAVLLFIGEIFFPTFLLACLGLGCLTSAVTAGAGFGLKGQLVGFILGTLASYGSARPFFQKVMHRSSDRARTNVDALVGKIGRVVVAVEPGTPSGRVLVGGDDWRAVHVDEGVLEPGTRVEVLRVEGTTLFVRKA
ncbi:MAG: NfeD family protein [Syntrophobacteraceae bacterium]